MPGPLPREAMQRDVLGLDIGGANLKAAHRSGAARQVAFELWKSPALLPAALRDLLQTMPAFEVLAVTMTGELCDCFETKREGVNVILDAVEEAARTPILVWQTNRSFVDTATARRTPLLTAASNWHALATFAGQYAPWGPALLLDIGSTTTDLVYFRDGQLCPRGYTDRERLQQGDLIYTGIRRTPLGALVNDRTCAELFATSQDVYLLLGDLPEEPENHFTADGRPATRKYAHARLARMLGGDGETCSEEETLQLAKKASQTQFDLIRREVIAQFSRYKDDPEKVILSGAGEFLARRIMLSQERLRKVRLISLTEKLGATLSLVAPAYAVAALADPPPW